eukprot:1389132-Lingulodinium_polyedra.AAC.1
MADAAFVPLRGGCFASEALDSPSKHAVADAFLLLRLFHGAATWGALGQRDVSALDKARTRYMRTIEAMGNAGLPHSERTSDVQVWKVAEAPGTRDLVRLQRLAYLPRFVQHAPVALKAMVQAAAGEVTSWAAQIVADIEWASALCPERCSELPPVRGH